MTVNAKTGSVKKPVRQLHDTVKPARSSSCRARNAVGLGGLLPTIADSSSEKVGIDQLLHYVASNAIFNTGGQVNNFQGYPSGEEVIQKLQKWIESKGLARNRMMWLNGPAGTGKTAISQVIVGHCCEREIYAANFIFCCGDGTRNNSRPLVLTVAYQLLEFYPRLYQPLRVRLTERSFISKASIGEQFRELISTPIQITQDSSPIQQLIILIIDGLDECRTQREQEEVLEALHALVEPADSPFLVLVSSRPLPHLIMFFNKIGSAAEAMFLHYEYTPQDSIRRFVATKLNEIKSAHWLSHKLPKSWPAESDIAVITDRSIGQLVYVEMVMRFIQYSPESPALTVLRVHELHPSTKHTPYAHLDTLYSYIFSLARDIHAVKIILGTHFIVGVAKFEKALELSGFGATQVKSLFANLQSVIQVNAHLPMNLVLHHTSLSDYLQEKSRSGIYYVNAAEIAVKLTTILLERFCDSASLNMAVGALIWVQDPTATLSKALLHAPTRTFEADFGTVKTWNLLMRTIDRLYFKTDKPLFKRILRNWIRFAYKNNADLTGVLLLESTSAARYYEWYQVIEQARIGFGLDG